MYRPTRIAGHEWLVGGVTMLNEHDFALTAAYYVHHGIDCLQNLELPVGPCHQPDLNIDDQQRSCIGG